MIKNRAPIASMFSFQLYTIAIMIGRNSVNRDRCMTFDILTEQLLDPVCRNPRLLLSDQCIGD
jgi:hypothetical protein